MKRFLISATSLILIFFIAAFIFFPLPGYIPVLMYHFIYPKQEVIPKVSSLNVSIDAFEQQMWFLKTFGYRVISMDKYYEIKTGLRKPRGKEILITFDDGHRTYITNALPILKRYQLRSTNFVVWRYLSSKWPDYINLNEAQRLSRNPLVSFESHTVTHPNLAKVPLSRAKMEIAKSKGYLERSLHKKIDYFAYPEGSFTPEIMELVREAGYRMAFRTAYKFNKSYPDYRSYPETPYSIVRIKVSPKYNLLVFWWYISGFQYYFKNVDHFFHQLTLPLTNGKLTFYKPQLRST